MPHKLQSVTPLSDFELFIRFRCGSSGRYDMKPLIDSISLYRHYLVNEGLFEQVRISDDGRALFWNEYVDIGCEILWQGSRPAKSPFNSLLSLGDAAAIWQVDESTLRKAAAKGRLKENYDILKFGKQWVVTRKAMEREFGPMPVFPLKP